MGGRIPSQARLRRFQIAERCGLVWVCLEESPRFDLPEFVHFADPDLRVLQVPAYDWECSAPRRFENVVDFAHFAWLHEGLLGSRDHPEVPRHEVRRAGGELRVEIGFEEPSDTQKNANLGLTDERVTAETRYRLFMPFSAVVEGQRPEELPVDLTAELHIRDADRVSIECRKWLYELAAGTS